MLLRLREAGAEDEVVLADTVIRRLGLATQTWVAVRAGGRQTMARVRAGDVAAGELHMGGSVLRTLLLDSPAAEMFRYRIRKTAPATVQIGPVVGILAGQTRAELRQNRHGFKIFDMLWDIRRIGGMGYFFTLEDIDWKRRLILGHTHIPGSVPGPTDPRRVPLASGAFPFPDVVYRRRSVPADVLERMRAEMTPWIFNNSRASHKFTQARLLGGTPGIAGHVPEMRPLDGPEVLDAMLNRYGTVFLKRRSLGAGHGVVRVVPADEGGYVLTRRLHSQRPQEERAVVPDFTALTRFLGRATGYAWSEDTWFVQQAVKLARWEGRPFDVRVTVQRDGMGHWVVNGMYVRIAPTVDSALTRRGGYELARGFFGRVWPGRGNEVYARVSAFALRCVTVLDRHLGPLGDVGVDVLIDESGKHWFLEANPGPGYLTVGPGDTEYPRVLSGPIVFASYLAGFPVGAPQWTKQSA